MVRLSPALFLIKSPRNITPHIYYSSHTSQQSLFFFNIHCEWLFVSIWKIFPTLPASIIKVIDFDTWKRYYWKCAYKNNQNCHAENGRINSKLPELETHELRMGFTITPIQKNCERAWPHMRSREKTGPPMESKGSPNDLFWRRVWTQTITQSLVPWCQKAYRLEPNGEPYVPPGIGLSIDLWDLVPTKCSMIPMEWSLYEKQLQFSGENPTYNCVICY